MRVNLNPAVLFFIVVLYIQPFMLPTVHAEDYRFEIRNAAISVEKGVYLLKADVDFVLSPPVREALLNGVSLVFVLEIVVLEYNDWWLNSQVAYLEQRYSLGYQALSRQYVVENINTGVQESFPDLGSALRHLGDVVDFPFIDSTLLDRSNKHILEIRVSLDVDELPLPLRVRTYLSSDWDLDTDWHTQRLP
jgi:hypothetical protein